MNVSTFLLAFVIALAPLALTLWRNKSESAKVNKHYLELLRLAGMQQGKAVDHFEDGTAIAIDREKRNILLLSGGSAKAYSYADIRSWTAKKEGFSVFVRDIEHPEWTLSMISPGASARWMEILTQEINERKE